MAVVSLTTFLVIAVWQWPSPAHTAAVFGVLAVRPSLDAFGTKTFGWSAWLPSPSAVFGLGVLVVGLTLALRRAGDRRPVWPYPYLRRTHAFLLIAYVIGFSSGTWHYGQLGLANGVRELLRVASIVAAFLLVLWWVEERPRMRRVGWLFLILGLCAPVIVSALQFVGGSGNLWTPGLNRLQGTFSDPNTLGPYLVPFILWAIADMRDRGIRAKALRLGAAAILVAILLATYSRTAVLVLVAGLAALAGIRVLRFGRRELIAGLGSLLVLGAVGWWLAGGLIERRFAGIRVDRATIEAAQGGESENSFTWRLINWGILITMSREHIAFGHGAGMTTQLNPLVSEITGIPFNAHNDFVRMLFETGVAGLAAYLVYVLMICTWAIRMAHEAPRALERGAYAVAASWLALALLTGGAPEVSLQTVTLYELYGMLALLGMRSSDGQPPVTPG